MTTAYFALSLGHNSYDSDNSDPEIVSLTSGKANSNAPLRSLVIALLNSSESLFPALHLLFIPSPSDLHGIPLPAQRGRKYSSVGSD